MKTYLIEMKCEFFSLARMPRFSFTTIILPAMFYVLFGILLQQRFSGGAPAAAKYFLSMFAAFGVMSAGLWGLGAGIAGERGLGWLEIKRASPMPRPSWFLAKIASALAFSGCINVILFALGAAFGGVRMAPLAWLALGAAMIASALPFCALGLVLGYLVTPNAAPAVINLVALPMAFFSGLWTPLHLLPESLQRIAPALPAYHAAQIGLAISGAGGEGTIESHATSLVALTMIFTGVAWLLLWHEEGRTHA
jgi:ABC-2 type transport system permease protein